MPFEKGERCRWCSCVRSAQASGPDRPRIWVCPMCDGPLSAHMAASFRRDTPSG